MSQHLSKEERQLQLIQAALAAFGKKGYHATQVSDIITEAKVARGTFYLYFEGKREIFNAVVSRIFEMVQMEIRVIPKDAVTEIPNQIRGNIKRVTNLLLENPLYIKLLFSDAVGLDSEFDERLQKFYEQILDYIRRGLKQGQEMGFVRDGNINVMAICLLGCIKEVFYQSVLGTEKQSANSIVKEVYSLVVSGISHPHLGQEIESLLKNFG